MNAYLIQEDGQSGVYIADTMAAALTKAYQCYIDEVSASVDKVDSYKDWNQDVQSCALLGEVKEPKP